MCALLHHTFLYIHTYVHAHNVSIHTVPIKCCRWNGAGSLMEFKLWRLSLQSETMGHGPSIKVGGVGGGGGPRLCVVSLHHEPLFTHMYVYRMYVATLRM